MCTCVLRRTSEFQRSRGLIADPRAGATLYTGIHKSTVSARRDNKVRSRARVGMVKFMGHSKYSRMPAYE